MTGRILIVDDEQAIRESLKMFLNEEGHFADIAADGEEALSKISDINYDLVITDIKMPKMDGIELLFKATEKFPDTFFIIMTAYASVKSAVEALRKGAYDYIIKPVEFDDLIVRVNRLLEYKKIAAENKFLRQRVSSDTSFKNIIGQSAPMKEIFDLISTVGPTNSSVLIYGKSGTGKELVAKAIHSQSHRKDKLFLPVNCGAISENLIESELFGYKKGAFTGAYEDKMGLFKVADGGTLFLDEIADLPLNLQVKLLRAIEDREFLPVGSTKPIKTDVRIIAATNQNIFSKVKEGTFREDLYYRLNVIEIKLPALNERRDDIPLLAKHFVEKYSNEMGKKDISIDNDTMRALMSHEWRGNVRELENVIERAVIFSKNNIITINELSNQIKTGDQSGYFPDSLKDATRKFEKDHILKTIKKYNFSKEEAAKAMMIGISSLYRKMDELDIPRKLGKKDSSDDLN